MAMVVVVVAYARADVVTIAEAEAIDHAMAVTVNRITANGPYMGQSKQLTD